MLKRVLLSVVVVLGIASCQKEVKPPDTTIPQTYDSLDIGIRFTRYQQGITYQTDTIQNEFELVNKSTFTLLKDNRFQTACKIGGVVFALDLIGQGPSPVKLPQDIAPGGTLKYNPGYLLGQSLLDYFGTDTVDICVMVYGLNEVEVSAEFASDPFPEDNMACLRFFAGGLQLK